MRTDNLNDDEFNKLKRRVEALESAAPLGFSSITRGALRVASAEGLIVEGSERVSGTLLVTGTETVDGTLQVTGHLIVGGDMAITGPTVMSGSFQVDGNTTINGETVINGHTTVNGVLDVVGGQVRVGSGIALDPSVGSGALIFSTGAQLYSGGGGAQLLAGGYAFQVSGSEISITNGATTIVIDGSGMHFYGLPTVAKAGVPAGVLVVDGGRVKITS